MTILSVLSSYEQKQFDSPPDFNTQQRRISFVNDNSEIISGLRKSTHKIGFILQLGYFRANGKFFAPNKFRVKDIEYVTKLLNLKSGAINFDTYHTRILHEHRIKILTLLEWKTFDQATEKFLTKHITRYVEKQLLPKEMFMLSIDFFWQNKIELPSYTKLSLSITNAYNQYETILLNKISSLLDVEQEKSLLALIRSEFEQKPQMFKPRITSLKKINQSLQPSDIQDNIEAFNVIQDYFNKFKYTIDRLDLSDQATEYFATWVHKATTSQLNSFANKNKSYLYLLAYIKHQYYLRQDTLIDIFLKSVKTVHNAANAQIEKNDKKSKSTRNKSIITLSKSHKSSRLLIDSITKIIKSTSLSKADKADEVEKLINDYNCSHNRQEIQQLINIEDIFQEIDIKHDYFDVLESLSMKLQHRVSQIVKLIDFHEHTSDKNITLAINYFKNKTDNLESSNLPSNFLTQNEQAVLYKGFSYLLRYDTPSIPLKSREIGLQLTEENLVYQVGDKVPITIEKTSISHALYNKIIQSLRNFSTRLTLNFQEKDEIFTLMLTNSLAVKKDKLRIPLYKILLFMYMEESIKAGKLNLKYSYRYRSIQEYLISKESWLAEKEDLLKSANLSKFANYSEVSEVLKQTLDAKYHQVNQSFLANKNEHLTIENNKIKIKTPKIDSNESKYVSSLLIKTGYIPILQVLTDVNQIVNFTDDFKYFSVKYKKMNPDHQSIFAGTIGVGCNIGINRIANSSIGITEDKLSNIVNWCFTLKNISNANNKILAILNKLALADSFKANQSKSHTSSDGKKSHRLSRFPKL